jgi:hypothetical protein
MKSKSQTITIICTVQLVVLSIWITVLWGSKPHSGTVINLGVLAVAAILGLLLPQKPKFKRSVIILNWIEVVLWGVSLLPAIIALISSQEAIWEIGVMTAMTLGIVVPCLANAILVSQLQNIEKKIANQ